MVDCFLTVGPPVQGILDAKEKKRGLTVLNYIWRKISNQLTTFTLLAKGIQSILKKMAKYPTMWKLVS